MYSQPMVLAASKAVSLGEAARAFVLAAQEKAQGGLTLQEFGELFIALMRFAIDFVDQLSLAGDRKKELVLEALGDLFDGVADKLVPLWLYPAWFFAKPAVRAVIMAAAGGAIEVILSMTRKEQK